ncbi:MAG: UxaA family hydrolase [Alphaproteobacteria bacterium]|nr:UxaA family hydrolase [Alphaproteobacteria bacterium]
MSDQTDDRLILLSPKDNVLVARVPLGHGEPILIEGIHVAMSAPLSMGHKIARRDILPGDKIIKYGVPIGSATASIRPGDHVHLHNLKSDYTASYALQPAQTPPMPPHGANRSEDGL